MSLKTIATAVLLALASGSALAQSYDRWHPDRYYRERAVEEAQSGRMTAALQSFESAARYADKASQLALALAHWTGEGTAVDRARGYAWADLAAERGWPAYLGVREQMWEQLDASERAHALEIGAPLAAEFADAVAKKRLERLLFQGSRRKTGTRTGSATVGVGAAQLDSSARASLYAALYTSGLNNTYAPGSGQFNPPKIQAFAAALRGIKGYQAAAYYGDANWKPKQYWQVQDEVWGGLPKGFVTIAPLQQGAGKPRTQ